MNPGRGRRGQRAQVRRGGSTAFTLGSARGLAQMTAPAELAELKSVAHLGYIQIRSTYDVNGRLYCEYGRLNAAADGLQWHNANEMGIVHAMHLRDEENARREARVRLRFLDLPVNQRPANYAGCTAPQRDLVNMSQTNWLAYVLTRGPEARRLLAPSLPENQRAQVLPAVAEAKEEEVVPPAEEKAQAKNA